MVEASRHNATRERIGAAFEQCVAQTGYAQTKWVDIAEAAEMSTPHLRYYFKNKESILVYRYAALVEEFEQRVVALDQPHFADWIEALGRLVFVTRRRSREALLVLIEANALASRLPEMQQIKSRYDRHMLSAIEQPLKAAAVANPDAAAAAIFHYITGLMLNTAFDTATPRELAIPALVEFSQRLAGLKNH